MMNDIVLSRVADEIGFIRLFIKERKTIFEALQSMKIYKFGRYLYL